MALASREVVCLLGIGLMSYHHIDIMPVELMGIVQDLLQVHVKLPLVGLGHHTFFAGKLAEPWVPGGGHPRLVEGDTSVECELEVLQEGYVNEACAVECIAFGQ